MKKQYLLGIAVITIALFAAFAIQSFWKTEDIECVLVDSDKELEEIRFVNLKTSMEKTIRRTDDLKKISNEINKIDSADTTKDIDSITNWSYRIIFSYKNETTIEASVLEDKVFVNGLYYKVGQAYINDLEKLYDSFREKEEKWVG